MIVQSAPEGQPRFVIKMTEHTAFAGQLARAFGNDRFEPVSPRNEMLYVIDHHDQGWVEWDEAPELHPETRLPYHLIHTPRPITLRTGIGSPDFNERQHPYCGLLSSMHIWGLYNGRYGFSDQVLLSGIPEEHRAAFDEMLAGQLERQARLKATLAADPKTAAWVEDPHLFQNYKQLQFFDTLALYFHCNHEGERGETHFLHVPMSEDADTTVTIRRLDADTYGFSPFPFGEDGVELSFDGRYLTPFPEGHEPDLTSVMRETPVEQQAVRFVAH